MRLLALYVLHVASKRRALERGEGPAAHKFQRRSLSYQGRRAHRAALRIVLRLSTSPQHHQMMPTFEAFISVVRVASLGWRRAASSPNGPVIHKDELRAHSPNPSLRQKPYEIRESLAVGASSGQAEGLAWGKLVVQTNIRLQAEHAKACRAMWSRILMPQSRRRTSRCLQCLGGGEQIITNGSAEKSECEGM